MQNSALRRDEELSLSIAQFTCELVLLLVLVVKPLHVFRIVTSFAVLQGIFFNFFFVLYIISPRTAHSFVGCASSGFPIFNRNALQSKPDRLSLLPISTRVSTTPSY